MFSFLKIELVADQLKNKIKTKRQNGIGDSECQLPSNMYDIY